MWRKEIRILSIFVEDAEQPQDLPSLLTEPFQDIGFLPVPQRHDGFVVATRWSALASIEAPVQRDDAAGAGPAAALIGTAGTAPRTRLLSGSAERNPNEKLSAEHGS
ncbi:hypothetical protein EYF80_022821 [Liparis tanakae]|uniref:Uncharacterized protein n=1 Tax=Liparis tanakae TaxID=230148 RepID=A0A4Z2HPL8_9TELE|nr:hypothetical protein EYF80_022821 [Liparis tanakae]